ncbi:hypothetical protein AB0I30_17125 [Nocardia tengchongensis]|uniref:hypothetical protein n=1 Tax=Nocardia tengchongensis TaxID=2055889 RepID=UPI0033F61919
MNMNGSNISVGSTGVVNQTMNAPTVISRDQLMQDLVNTGLSQAQLDALTEAAERDGVVVEPGPAVTSWFNEIRSNLTAAAVTTVWGLVTAYAGLPAAS